MPTTSLLTSTSRTPPRTSASASPTFWQHWPTAPARDLLARDDRALVGLGVRPQPHAGRARERRHLLEVALERVEIDDERGRVDVVEPAPDLGGRDVHVTSRRLPISGRS